MPALQPCAIVVGLVVPLSGCAHRRGSEQATPAKGPTATTAEVVDSQDIRHNPGQPIEEALMGRFPGVTVTRTPDGGVAVLIRGGSSINSSNTPLYIIDGVPIEPGPGGSLAGISPNEIASITVLKQPTETATYGPRGVNGVIIIKLKRP